MPLDPETLARRWPALSRRLKKTRWILSGETFPSEYDLDRAYPFFRGRVTADIQEWGRSTKSNDPGTQALIDALIDDPCLETVEELQTSGYNHDRLKHYLAALGDPAAARELAVHLLLNAPLNDQGDRTHERRGDVTAITMIATALGYLSPPGDGEHPPTWWLDRLARIGAALQAVRELYGDQEGGDAD